MSNQQESEEFYLPKQDNDDAANSPLTIIIRRTITDGTQKIALYNRPTKCDLKKLKSAEKDNQKRKQLENGMFQLSQQQREQKITKPVPKAGFPKSRRVGPESQQLYLQVNKEYAAKFWGEIDELYFKRYGSEQFHRKKQDLNKQEFSTFEIENTYNQENYFSSYRQWLLQQVPELKYREDKLAALLMKTIQNRISHVFLVLFQCVKSQMFQNAEEGQEQYMLYNGSTNSSLQLKTFGNDIISKDFIKKQDRLSYGFKLKETHIVKIDDIADNLMKYNKILFNSEYKSELDKEIAIWKKELNDLQAVNRNHINLIQNRMSNEIIRQYNNKEIDEIRQKLLWSNILKLFIEGHTDKTKDIFQYFEIQMENLQLKKTYSPSATKGTTEDYLQTFQTDCKICFCGSNHDNNKVLYCDSCNTSYHQNCYGLTSIPKSDKYYCDTCLQQKKLDANKKDRFICKICWRKSFPMKNLNGHFYHVTCLVLNNLVEIKNKQLALKKDITFQSITKKVIQLEISQKYCEFCVQLEGCQNGWQFKCQALDCKKTFHPICAYLNGCLFQLKIQKKTEEFLNVKIYCNDHHPQRDYLEQVYFRRYVCDLKKTSQLDYESFVNEYRKEEEERLKYKKKADSNIITTKNNNQNIKINLLKVTPTIKYYHKKLKEQALQKILNQRSKLLQKSEQQKRTIFKPSTNEISQKGKSFFDDD